jgi:UDP-glucose 4-epimerase
MTVLITGGAGYIGSHMVHALADVGERAVVLDNLATGFDWAVARDASLVIGDCGDQSHVAALLQNMESTPSSISPPRPSCRTRFATRSATTVTTR